MQSSLGASIDPVSGRPAEQVEAGQKKKYLQRQAARLKQQAAMSETVSSDAAEALRAMIHKKLFRRIGEILADDPECFAYVEMCRELNERKNLAKIATDKLVAGGYL
jgi:hypothetical protein